MIPMMAQFAQPLAAGAAASTDALLTSIPTILNRGYAKQNKAEIARLEEELRGFNTDGLTDAEKRIMYSQLTVPGLAAINQAKPVQNNFGGFTNTGSNYANQLMYDANRSSLIGQMGMDANAQVLAANVAQQERQKAELERLRQEYEARVAYRTQDNQELMSAWLEPVRAGSEAFGQSLGVEKTVGEGGVPGQRPGTAAAGGIPAGWSDVLEDPDEASLIFDGFDDSLAGVV